MIEDDATAPKTSLGQRAALEQGRQLGAVDMKDPDQRYYALTVLGIPEIDPALDVQVQAAQRKQEAFEHYLTERQVMDPAAPMPLLIDPWNVPIIFERECLKWANSDRMVDLFEKFPASKQVVASYLESIRLMMGMLPNMPIAESPIKPPAGIPGGAPALGGGAMENSNRETGNPADVPSGTGEGAQNQGPT